jgi:hypothetical protein
MQQPRNGPTTDGRFAVPRPSNPRNDPAASLAAASAWSSAAFRSTRSARSFSVSIRCSSRLVRASRRACWTRSTRAMIGGRPRVPRHIGRLLRAIRAAETDAGHRGCCLEQDLGRLSAVQGVDGNGRAPLRVLVGGHRQDDLRLAPRAGRGVPTWARWHLGRDAKLARGTAKGHDEVSWESQSDGCEGV